VAVPAGIIQSCLFACTECLAISELRPSLAVLELGSVGETWAGISTVPHDKEHEPHDDYSEYEVSQFNLPRDIFVRRPATQK
jgi:hypothetical protein